MAGQPRTSRRISTARCRGGRCWIAARKASSIVSLATASSSGSSSSPARPRRAAGPGRAAATGSPPARGRGRRRRVREEVQAGVGRDPVQPRPEGRPGLVASRAAPGAQERLLHQVLGVVERAEHPVAVHPQLAPMTCSASPDACSSTSPRPLTPRSSNRVSALITSSSRAVVSRCRCDGHGRDNSSLGCRTRGGCQGHGQVDGARTTARYRQVVTRDQDQINEVVRTFFAAFRLSGPDVEARLDGLRALLLPEAVILRTCGDVVALMSRVSSNPGGGC